MTNSLKAKAIDLYTNDPSFEEVATVFNVPYGHDKMIRVWNNEHHLFSVDKSYIFDKELLRVTLSFLNSAPSGDGLMFYGPFGCGKTSFIRQVLARLKWPTLMLSWDERSETADLIGRMDLSFGNTEFVDGPLTLAVKHGYALVINEIDRGHAGNLVALNDLLDGGNLVIRETNQIIEPHPNFRLIVTANSAGRGDMTGAFTGSVRKLDPAFLDRFLMLKVAYMDQVTETDLMMRNFSEFANESASFVTSMCKFAAETRQKSDDPTEGLSLPLTTRGLSRFFRLGCNMGLYRKLNDGAKINHVIDVLTPVYLNRLTKDEREVALQLLRLHAH